ncbi:MAG TPA: thiamine-phosphate kinase [Mycobacteriales bacterium]|nr:thiamine-phosphate kinase [Mycobacteriales bacterium]
MSTTEHQPSRLAAVGEFGLIRRLVPRFALTAAVEVGPGDDAAVVRSSDGRVVATTDLLVEGRHFRLDWSSPYDVGRKAAAQSLSDVAAMGARPTALLVGLGAPPETAVDLLEAVAEGLAAECGLVGATVVGGDVVRTDGLLLAVTALGDLEGRRPVRRDGARPGDRIVVAGGLGGAAAGLAMLTAGRSDVPAEVLAAHRRPEPPYAAGPLLAASGATSLIDVSDGFAGDLGHVLEASGVGATVDVEAIPRHRALRTRWADDIAADVLTAWLVSGGEDHALVATLSPGDVAAATAALLGAGIALVDVGTVATGAGITWLGLPAGTPPPGGFDHFSAR